MKLSQLDFPEEVISVLEKSGITELNPAQSAAVKAGLLEKKNLVVAAPTASGKTLTAELAFVRNFLNNSKTIYLVPLRALASEKYREFKEKYEKIGMRIAISIGDLDSDDGWLRTYDLVIASNEKMDSILRHNPDWISRVTLVIADEIHLINDASRGPTLEVVLTRLREITNAQILALSATIQNAEELAGWLGAELVKSDYRPVKLHVGVFSGDGDSGKLKFLEKEGYALKTDTESEAVLSRDTLSRDKQALVFLSTRASAEAAAEKIGKTAEKFLNKEEKEKLAELSGEALNALGSPTKQCKRLSSLLKNGVAFHHAGLVAKQRQIVEDNFRSGLIKILAATPTLCLDSSVKVWNGMANVDVSKMNPRKVWALHKEELVEAHPKNLTEIKAPKIMVKIKAVSGDEIVVTPNHKVLVKNEGKKRLIEASSCKPKYKIASVGHLNVKPTDTPKWSDFVIENKIPFEDKILDGDIFYFIGVMLGDGYSGAEIHDGRIVYKGSPCLVGRDIDIFNRIKLVCNKHSIHYKEGKNYYGVPQLVLSKSKWLREFLVRCGIDIGRKKHINKKLLYSHKEMLSHLLRGLFDTDGCMEKRTKRISFSNNSSNLIDEIRRSLLRYGIVTSFRKRNGGSIKMFGQTCKTKENIELYIQHRECLDSFYKEIGFGVERKARYLEDILNGFGMLINKFSCKHCNYQLFLDTFGGRTWHQKYWGKQKLEIIKFLGNNEGLKSWKIKKKLGFVPWKKERRLNHHFNLITRKRVGNHVEWELNKIGIWVFENILQKNQSFKKYFQTCNTCPLCSSILQKKLRGTWKTKDFQEDIYWNRIKSVGFVKPSSDKVYDLVLANDGNNDHMFVANGFIVHNSFGMNLPAWRVIVRDTKRFSGYGSDYIPVMEMHQMFGRAGRPKYDSDGEAVMIAKSKSEAEELWERYVIGEPEPIYSKLSVESVLRIHVLSLIACGAAKSLNGLKGFFSKTFFAHQYKNVDEVMDKVNKVLKELESYGFIRSENFISADFVPAFEIGKDINLEATRLGKRVSELYLDPKSAQKLIESMKPQPDIGCILAACQCVEMRPLVSVKQKDAEWIEAALEDSGLVGPDAWDIDYEDFLKAFKTSLMLEDWMAETGEDKMNEKYGITPGELYAKTTSAEWVFYSMSELAKLLNKKYPANTANKLKLRIRYGIKEELLPLVRIKNIGRARARLLFKNGIKSLSDIKKAPLQKLETILGKSIAKQLKETAEENLDEKMKRVKRGFD